MSTKLLYLKSKESCFSIPLSRGMMDITHGVAVAEDLIPTKMRSRFADTPSYPGVESKSPAPESKSNKKNRGTDPAAADSAPTSPAKTEGTD